MEVIFIVHSFSILNIVQDKKDFLEMAMTQSPKLYLICALLALSVDLMKGFIDLCSTQPEREHQYFLNMPTFNLVSKCNFIKMFQMQSTIEIFGCISYLIK